MVNLHPPKHVTRINIKNVTYCACAETYYSIFQPDGKVSFSVYMVISSYNSPTEWIIKGLYQLFTSSDVVTFLFTLHCCYDYLWNIRLHANSATEAGGELEGVATIKLCCWFFQLALQAMQ